MISYLDLFILMLSNEVLSGFKISKEAQLPFWKNNTNSPLVSTLCLCQYVYVSFVTVNYSTVTIRHFSPSHFETRWYIMTDIYIMTDMYIMSKVLQQRGMYTTYSKWCILEHCFDNCCSSVDGFYYNGTSTWTLDSNTTENIKIVTTKKVIMN